MIEAEADNLNELEELVLKETIVSAMGISTGSLQIGLRGDPSIRETTMDRKRYPSVVDERIDAIVSHMQELLLNRSTYRIFVGYNNGEIRTNSIFDPLVQETHTAEKFADPTYIDRHFPRISYAEKVALIRSIYKNLRADAIYQVLPEYWRNIMLRRSKEWEPMEQQEILNIVAAQRPLREMPVYFMRNILVCIVQSLVRIQFNCDGTQIISAENFQRFLEENLPPTGT